MPGYEDECDDVNECREDPSLCQNGRCVNSEGGFRCECYSGYTSSADKKSCIGENLQPLNAQHNSLSSP